MRIDILIFLFVSNSWDLYFSYNIDLNSPYIKSIPSSGKSSFGFSISIFTQKVSKQKYIIVGAPTDQVKTSQTKSPGAFYTCPLTKYHQDCVPKTLNDKSDSSLFGYVVESSYSDGAIYTCAPRFLKSLHNVKYVEGSCWELNDNYTETDTISNSYCVDSINKNNRDYEFRNCLTGGALKSLGNKQLLLTAPYSYEGRGLLINSIFQSESNSRVSRYLRVDGLMSKYQLTGLSMSVGRIYREHNVRTVVLGAPGMPQSNLTNPKMGYGQVMLVKLLSDMLSFEGLISGDSFGGAFGYSVLSLDLNGDGYDELVVGAPFTGNNRGRVFIYWNVEQQEATEAGYTFPLTIKTPLILQSLKKSDNGQFGNCLENIGDINKDSFLDLAVGSPFEDDGRGSVYIYLGSGDGRVTLAQKIDASEIDIDLRGFGFSMHGKNEDLDGNNFPDVTVGAVVSGHVVGLRTRPLITVYADNLFSKAEEFISFNLSSLPKCKHLDRDVYCVNIRIRMFYYYTLNHRKVCHPNSQSMVVSYTVNLDRKYLNSSPSKRVHFDSKLNTITGSLTVDCKLPELNSNTDSKLFNVLFPDIVFFNISEPIELVLNWSMADIKVPKRNYVAEETIVDLLQYPVINMSNLQLVNKILFGAGCGPDSCKPNLRLHADLELKKTIENEHILYIGSSSSFDLNVKVTNIATSDMNRAYNTLVKIDYLSGGIDPSSATSVQYIQTSSGLTYAVKSPLEAQSSDSIKFTFSLSNDFLNNAEKYIYMNVSLQAMSPQPDITTIVMKIKILMIVNIDLKVSVTQIDATSYQQVPLLGISAITDEKKIGPRIKLKISLSNMEQTSVIVSSKLVIYFPWEVTGDPTQTHGQYLLYLQRIPKFFISGGKRNITCDQKSLMKLVNPIKTKMFETKKDESQIQDVSFADIPLPKKTPKPTSLRKELSLVSGETELQSAWQKHVLFDCMNGTARCVPIVCDMGPLSRLSGEINIELDLRIWIHTFVENFIKYKFVQTEIPIYWIPDADYDIVFKNSDSSFKSAGIKADNLQKPKAPPSMNLIWAILIAVCIGVILLSTIILILYKCHFFRRQNLAAARKRRKATKQF